MEFGLSGKRGIVCAASKGLGRGVAVALAREGVSLVINARGQATLKAVAEEIGAKTGVDVIPVAADISAAGMRVT